MTYDVLARAARGRRLRRIRLLLLSGTALALLAAAFAIVGGQLHHTTSSTVPPPGTTMPATATPTATATGQPDPGSGAPLPGDLSWTHIDGVPVPVSASAGPTRAVGESASGFAHSRAGAVLAAVNVLARITPQAGPTTFDPTLHSQVSGPYAPALATQVHADYQQLCTQAGVTPGGPVGTVTARFAGYQVQLYSDNTALITLLTEAPRSGSAPLYIATVVQMTWHATDWSLIAPAGGVWDQSVTRVAADGVAAFNPFAAGR